MRISFLSKSISLLVLVLATFLASGCGDSTQPPTAISMDQIPTELGKAFASAKGDAKELSGLAVTAVQSKEFPKASMVLQALARRSELDTSQSRVVAGAAMTINAALLKAESKGDPRAAEALDLRRKTK